MKIKLAVSALVSGLVFVGGLAACIVTFPEPQQAMAADAAVGITWHKEMSAARTEAASQNKYVFADVYTDWCGWCKRLDRDTFSDRDFIKFAESKFICVKVNAEDGKANRKIASDARVSGFPCGLVYNPQGKLIGKISGYLEPAEYQKALQDVLDRYAKNPNVNALREDQ